MGRQVNGNTIFGVATPRCVAPRSQGMKRLNDHQEEIRYRLGEMRVEPPPAPWRAVATVHIGGFTEGG